MSTKPPAKAEQPVAGELVKAAVGGAPREGDVLSQYLNREDADTETTAIQTHAAIIHQILHAPDLDSVLEIFEPQTLADFEGRTLRIDGFTFQESEFEGGPPIYVSIMVFDENTGTKHLINAGEQRIIAQLMWFKERDVFPVRVSVHLATKANKYGRRMAAFGKPEAPRG